MAHSKLPDGQETFSAPTALWGPKSVTMFKKSQELPRRSSPAKFPLCLYNGQSARDTRRPHPRAHNSARPPPSRRGMLTSGPPPEPPEPTRAPPRPPAPAARRRAASAGPHPPSAGSARRRHCARAAERLSAARRGDGGSHPGGVPRLRAPEPRVVPESKWRPHKATPRPRPQRARRRPPAPGK